jgi:hypothetical protein
MSLRQCQELPVLFFGFFNSWEIDINASTAAVGGGSLHFPKMPGGKASPGVKHGGPSIDSL